jgi:RNase H-fold protein (predicted Holliday junction resolvase)
MRFTKALAKNLTIPFEYFDESYSTADAEAMLAASGGPAVPLDAAAAAVILQNYLNASAAPLI